MKRTQSAKVRKHRSRGEMISTFIYILVGVFFAGETRVLFDEGEVGSAILMGLFACASIAGGLRFHIHNLWHRISELRK